MNYIKIAIYPLSFLNFRSNSSILGQKHKNQKKAEQKRRKAARRVSEGDVPSSSSFEADSGLEENVTEKNLKKKGGNKRSKVADRFLQENQAADLIFNLDI